MTEVLAVFRSRSQAMDCAERLKINNLPSSLISTPKEAKAGCGLSVKIALAAFTKARAIIARGNYSSFYCYLKMDERYGRIFITRM